MKKLTIIFLLIFVSVVKGDVERFSLVKTDSLAIKSEDGSATLRVRLERFERDDLKVIETEGDFSIWHGKRQLPFDVMLTPTMIAGFDLTIDGKIIKVPKNFWNDIGGLELRKLEVDPKRPVKTPDDEFALERFLEEDERSFPKISRTPQGSTVLITWIRSEE